jgi:hypothetical protein
VIIIWPDVLGQTDILLLKVLDKIDRYLSVAAPNSALFLFGNYMNHLPMLGEAGF